jgi:hypothetical protein
MCCATCAQFCGCYNIYMQYALCILQQRQHEIDYSLRNDTDSISEWTQALTGIDKPIIYFGRSTTPKTLPNLENLQISIIPTPFPTSILPYQHTTIAYTLYRSSSIGYVHVLEHNRPIILFICVQIHPAAPSYCWVGWKYTKNRFVFLPLW